MLKLLAAVCLVAAACDPPRAGETPVIVPNFLRDMAEASEEYYEATRDFYDLLEREGENLGPWPIDPDVWHPEEIYDKVRLVVPTEEGAEAFASVLKALAAIEDAIADCEKSAVDDLIVWSRSACSLIRSAVYCILALDTSDRYPRKTLAGDTAWLAIDDCTSQAPAVASERANRIARSASFRSQQLCAAAGFNWNEYACEAP